MMKEVKFGFLFLEEEIASRLRDSYVFLGYEDGSWYFLQ